MMSGGARAGVRFLVFTLPLGSGSRHLFEMSKIGGAPAPLPQAAGAVLRRPRSDCARA